MRLTENTTHDGFLPEAARELVASFKTPTHHLARRVRPPAGIYAVSIQQVVSRFERVLSEYEASIAEAAAKQDAEKLTTDPLLESLDALFDALAEHLEDCTKILSCFFPETEEPTRNPHVRRFRNSIDPYRRYVTHRVNHIKHQHGRIRSVVVEAYGGFHFGFYFEGVRQDGVVAPEPDIHRRVQVHSLARELRFHAYNIYDVGRHLADAVRRVGEPMTAGVTRSPQVSNRFATLLQQLAKLPRVVFPGEESIDWPEARVSAESPLCVELQMTSARAAGLRGLPQGARIVVTLGVDGTPNQSYALPLYK